MVSILSIPSALVQMAGYGSGFLAQKTKSLQGLIALDTNKKANGVEK